MIQVGQLDYANFVRKASSHPVLKRFCPVLFKDRYVISKLLLRDEEYPRDENPLVHRLKLSEHASLPSWVLSDTGCKRFHNKSVTFPHIFVAPHLSPRQPPLPVSGIVSSLGFVKLRSDFEKDQGWEAARPDAMKRVERVEEWGRVLGQQNGFSILIRDIKKIDSSNLRDFVGTCWHAFGDINIVVTHRSVFEDMQNAIGEYPTKSHNGDVVAVEFVTSDMSRPTVAKLLIFVRSCSKCRRKLGMGPVLCDKSDDNYRSLVETRVRVNRFLRSSYLSTDKDMSFKMFCSGQTRAMQTSMLLMFGASSLRSTAYEQEKLYHACSASTFVWPYEKCSETTSRPPKK
jgi:hypothetical protein